MRIFSGSDGKKGFSQQDLLKMTAKQASKPKRGKELDRELNTRTQKMTHQGTEMAILI